MLQGKTRGIEDKALLSTVLTGFFLQYGRKWVRLVLAFIIRILSVLFHFKKTPHQSRSG